RFAAGLCKGWSCGHFRYTNVVAIIGSVSLAIHLYIEVRQENIAELVDGDHRIAIRLPHVVVRGYGKFVPVKGNKALGPTSSVVHRSGKLAGIELESSS